MKNKLTYTKSSGNIFADLGLENPEECLAKADLAIQINKLIRQKRLTQSKAAEILGIDQPKISALNTGKLSGFSLERLFRFLNILGQDITIKITPKKLTKPTARVSVALPKIKRTPAPKTPVGAPTSTRIQARRKSK